MEQLRFKKNTGQSLVEVLIAVTVGAILIAAAATLIAATLRSSAANKYLQPASYLAQGLIDQLTTFAETKWYCPPPGICNGLNLGIYNLNKGPAALYFLATTTSGTTIWQAVIPGVSEDIREFEGIQFTRYFYLENVCRNFAGALGQAVYPPTTCVASEEDPSTQKVTAVVSWLQNGEHQQIQVSKFLTRSRNQVFVQTDWSGGPAPGDPPVTAPNSKFYSATPNINYTGTPGSIYVQP